MQSCAELEEYLKENYIGSVGSDKVLNNGDEIELTPLEEMIRVHSEYFFKNGNYDYVIYEHNNNGKINYLKIRLINKQNLDDEIKKQLKGGEAEGNSREAYLNFKDVYGITDDLEVFYCSDGIISAVGANYLNSSIFDETKVMYTKDDPASKVLAESTGTVGRDLTIADLRATRELTISDQSGAKDLSFLIDMPNVSELTIRNYHESLKGIENLEELTFLYIDNTGGNININYEGLSGATSLQELKFYMPTDIEVEKMCTEMGKSDYKKLSKLWLYGYEENGAGSFITNLADSELGMNPRASLTTLSCLSNLTTLTKNEITTLYINNNKLKSLDGIQDFTNIKNLYVNNNSVSNINLEIRNKLTKMTNLKNLFCGYCNITDEDFKNIVANKQIENLSIPGNTLIKDLSILTELTELQGLQARRCQNLELKDNELVTKIAKLANKYLDDKYATKLALAYVGSEVWLGTDASNGDVDILISKSHDELNKIKKFEIPNNENITDDKLQILLEKLTQLTVLIADGSNLKSFDFIKKENNTIRQISVLNTSISDLKNLEKISNLGALRINTSGLNLKQYSKLVSNICKNAFYNYTKYSFGSVAIGGLNTTAEILNTLNGTPESPNEEFTNFCDYSGGQINSEMSLVDFSFTGLTEIVGTLWDNLTIKLPANFKGYSGEECSGAYLDYSNVTQADYYDSLHINSLNFDSFNGYKNVSYKSGDVLKVIGSNTLKLCAGKSHGGVSKEPKMIFNFSEITAKAPNITDLAIYGGTGFSDITALNRLNLTDLEIQYSSIYGLKSQETNFGNMMNSLTKLVISNCLSFYDLDGLESLKNITTLDLTNDVSLSNIQMVTKNGTKEAINTCQYIVTSLPQLKTIKLKGSGIDNYTYLTNGGFQETENGSGEFVRK